MGGSVYRDPKNPGDSPVTKGATIALRLGHVDRTIIDDQHAFFKDRPESAEFGTIQVLSIGADQISILYRLFDAAGNAVDSRVRDIALNGTPDIDGDALPDIPYQKETPNRPGWSPPST